MALVTGRYRTACGHVATVFERHSIGGSVSSCLNVVHPHIQQLFAASVSLLFCFICIQQVRDMFTDFIAMQAIKPDGVYSISGLRSLSDSSTINPYVNGSRSAINSNKMLDLMMNFNSL